MRKFNLKAKTLLKNLLGSSEPAAATTPKNFLGGLINEAIREAYETGYGYIEDESGTSLGVSAHWIASENNPQMRVLRIEISQQEVVWITYDEPGTERRK